MTFFEHAVQAWILIFSGGAAVLIARTDRWHRWGHIFGLVSQPAYFITTWMSGQWALLLLTAWYTFYWWRGIAARFFPGGIRLWLEVWWMHDCRACHDFRWWLIRTLERR